MSSVENNNAVELKAAVHPIAERIGAEITGVKIGLCPLILLICSTCCKTM